MRISHQWLKEYIDVRLSPEKLSEGLSMLGLEVAGFEDLSKQFSGFVVGEVLEKRKHPNADRLTVCRVQTGKEELEIVCGAPNVEAGQKVVVATVGAVIPHNQHDPEGKPFVLERTALRGVESNGMICSAYELGLGDDAEGILVLEPSAKAGTPLAQYLGRTDIVYELEITPNRGDWLSHFGVAREVGAMLGKKMQKPTPRFRESRQSARVFANVQILDPVRCARYSSRILRRVRVQPSPQWLQRRLENVGIRPINNVVDVTNYVMMETGQPLHAFDYDRLAGHSIVVRTAEEGEVITTLDGKERKLTSDILLICDAKKPVAIAGVMGGANSEIDEATTTVLLESAHFNASAVRRASRTLGLSTDASQRFERGTDIEITVYALDRVAELLQRISNVEVLAGVLDVYPRKARRRSLVLRVGRTNAVLGTALSKSQIRRFLERLELRCTDQGKDRLRVSIPTFRNDLQEEIDLIEEVARLYGYNNIETKSSGTVHYSIQPPQRFIEEDLRSYLIGRGFTEILANTLLDAKTASVSSQQAVRVINPVSADMVYLRTNLLAGALNIVRYNLFQKQRSLRLFEIGNVFYLSSPDAPLSFDTIVQEEHLLLLLVGESTPPSHALKSRPYDFFDVRGEVEALLSKFSLDKSSIISYDTHDPLSEYSLAIEIHGTYAGLLGRVKKSVTQQFEISEEVYFCELKTAPIEGARRRWAQYTPVARFPVVERDLAFVVGAEVPQAVVEQAIRAAGGELLSQVRLFDVFTGEQLGAGRKSLAYALEFQPRERTLTVIEVEQTLRRIIEHVGRECGGILREG